MILIATSHKICSLVALSGCLLHQTLLLNPFHLTMGQLLSMRTTLLFTPFHFLTGTLCIWQAEIIFKATTLLHTRPSPRTSTNTSRIPYSFVSSLKKLRFETQ